jgi:hypothetical protein
MQPAILAFALGLVMATARAASGQDIPARFGLEGGVLYATVDGSDFEGTDAGMGYHAQGRLLFRFFSIGAGVLRTSHDVEESTSDLKLSGFFVEPRYTFPTAGNAHPFVSARFAKNDMSFTVGSFTAEAPGTAWGIGGGMNILIGPSLDLNLGVAYNKISFGNVTVNGNENQDSDTKGSSVTFQVGLTYVFGRASATRTQIRKK